MKKSKILLAIVFCVAVAVSPLWAQDEEQQVYKSNTSRSPIVERFAAPLKVSITLDWEQYVIEGIGWLDETGVNLIQRALINVLSEVDSANRTVYTLLMVEHFRNDNRQRQKLPVEYRVAAQFPAAKQYENKVSTVFDNISSDIVSTYQYEMKELKKKKLTNPNLDQKIDVLNMNGAVTSSNEYKSRTSPNERKTPVNERRVSSNEYKMPANEYGVASNPDKKRVERLLYDGDNDDRIESNKRRYNLIERRTNTNKLQLTKIEQRIDKNNRQLQQITAQQKTQQQRQQVQQQKERQLLSNQSRQIADIERRAKASENRLTEIEVRMDRSEKALQKIDNNIEKVMKTAAQPYSRPKYQEKPRKRLAASQKAVLPTAAFPAVTEKPLDVKLENEITAMVAEQPLASPALMPVSTPAPEVSVAANTNTAVEESSPAPVFSTTNVFRPSANNTAGGACSISDCNAIENWLLDWYMKYSSYSEADKQTSNFLLALKDAKTVYDRQNTKYPKKLKFLLKKFDLIPNEV